MATLFDDASLVMIPSGYKDDKLYSIKPTSGDGDFTFSRDGSGASPATRVNSAGLIEKGRTNLLLQSNTFDTTWGATGGTMVGGQADKDGGNDAWVFTANATGQSRFNQTISVSGVNTISMYAKAGTANFLCLYIIGSGDPRAFFNLSTGAVGSTGSNIDANIEDVGNGWYRCSLTFDRTSSTLWCFVANTDGNFNSAIGDSIYIQDAQLEKGLVATSVIETTTAAASAGILGDMPRLDYSGGASCPSLLLEPARTNVVASSEYTDSYGKNQTPIITDNAHTSPEGVTNATNLNINAVNEGFYVFPTSVTSGESWTVSCFIKYIDGSNAIRFGHAGTGFGGDNTNVFNVETGTVVSTDGGTCSVEDYGSGWYRLIATRTASASSTGGFILYGNTATDSNFAVYGFQMEAGSYATSYVPTYGSATARAADSCSVTGVSDVIGQTEGTLFAEIEKFADGYWYLTIGDGTSSNWIFIGEDLGKMRGYVRTSAGVQTDNRSADLSVGVHKMAIAYKVNDVAIYLDGTQVFTDNSAAMPTTLNKISLTAAAAGVPANQTLKAELKQYILFPTRLTNTELAALTTL